MPSFPTFTPQVFAQFAKYTQEGKAFSNEKWSSTAKDEDFPLTYADVVESLGNDLFPAAAALQPGLRQVHDICEQGLSPDVLCFSGSGSSFVILPASQHETTSPDWLSKKKQKTEDLLSTLPFSCSVFSSSFL
jgi:4-diphosphocytidyl-2C-methyl-D-erythritol kinase